MAVSTSGMVEQELSEMRTDYHIEAPVETVFEFFYDPRKQEEITFGNYELGSSSPRREWAPSTPGGASWPAFL